MDRTTVVRMRAAKPFPNVEISWAQAWALPFHFSTYRVCQSELSKGSAVGDERGPVDGTGVGTATMGETGQTVDDGVGYGGGESGRTWCGLGERDTLLGAGGPG